MKPRFAPLLLLPLALPALAAGDGGDPFLLKKIFNFAILAAGIGYLFMKVLGPALRSQQREIAGSLDQARLRAGQAEARAREMDARIGGLEAEVAALREKAAAEIKAEAERIGEDTAAQLARIGQNAGQEIDSAVKFARQELKAYSAALAVELAGRQIAASLDEAAQGRLVHRFTAALATAPADRN